MFKEKNTNESSCILLAITVMLAFMSLMLMSSLAQASDGHHKDKHFSHTIIKKEGKTIHQVTMTAMENEVEVDNAGKVKYAAMTFGGTMPGPVVRVTQGDIIEFTLINPATNAFPHSMDFHAAVVDVLDEFGAANPGETKKFTFEARYAGLFMYHCGASPMPMHISRGMFGVIMVDPKEGFTESYPKPDREYFLVQSQFWPDPLNIEGMMENTGWTQTLINGKAFHYTPVHDPASKLVLEAKPGELVRLHYVNANINNVASMHPIAGIWDRVYVNGSPKNIMYDMQTHLVPVSGSASYDIVSPADRPTNNAIVDHNMSSAMRGAITILMNKPDANPELGRGNPENMLLRVKN
ncbi:MAG: multicopper oxidase domain-containing protein [Thiotrichales bacterium]|nr:multicopper oxidase domain-containing protein [Thiotrichales bacterium]